MDAIRVRRRGLLHQVEARCLPVRRGRREQLTGGRTDRHVRCRGFENLVALRGEHPIQLLVRHGPVPCLNLALVTHAGDRLTSHWTRRRCGHVLHPVGRRPRRPSGRHASHWGRPRCAADHRCLIPARSLSTASSWGRSRADPRGRPWGATRRQAGRLTVRGRVPLVAGCLASARRSRGLVPTVSAAIGSRIALWRRIPPRPSGSRRRIKSSWCRPELLTRCLPKSSRGGSKLVTARSCSKLVTAGGFTEAARRLTAAAGGFAKATRRLTEAAGRLPKAAGRLPKAARRLPEAARRLPKAARGLSRLIAAGGLPETAGCLPETAGGLPKPARCLTKAAGGLPESPWSLPKPSRSLPKTRTAGCLPRTAWGLAEASPASHRRRFLFAAPISPSSFFLAIA